MSLNEQPDVDLAEASKTTLSFVVDEDSFTTLCMGIVALARRSLHLLRWHQLSSMYSRTAAASK